jgi:ParB-like chromosome segregation protein Spo0J
MNLELRINPEYKALMPELPEDEFESLKNSIQKHGYWEEYPIIVNDKYEILDGHTRYRVCKELGIEPTIKVKHFESKEEEMEFVIETNLSRRHLTTMQKAELALKLIEITKVKAGRPKEKGKISFPEKEISKDTWQEVGKKVGVSVTTIEKAKEILEKGDAELIEKCRKGEISVAEAYRRIKEKEKLPEIVPPEEIFFQDMLKYFASISTERLETILTTLSETVKFINDVLEQSFLQKKELIDFRKKIEKLRDFLSEIISYGQHVKEGEAKR